MKTSGKVTYSSTIYHDLYSLSVSVPNLSLSTTPGSVGDRLLALHRAFHPANSRRHSPGSLERSGVLPKTPVGEAAGDQCEFYKVGLDKIYGY